MRSWYTAALCGSLLRKSRPTPRNQRDAFEKLRVQPQPPVNQDAHILKPCPLVSLQGVPPQKQQIAVKETIVPIVLKQRRKTEERSGQMKISKDSNMKAESNGVMHLFILSARSDRLAAHALHVWLKLLYFKNIWRTVYDVKHP